MFNFLVSQYAFGFIPMYGSLITIGIIGGGFYAIKEGKKLGIWSDFIFWGSILIVILSIIGARLWYVIFNWGDGWTIARILIHDGNGLQGLAIQGGLMAAIISIYAYSKKYSVSVHKVFDIVAPGFFIGQIIGRWGNFFNQELYGPIVNPNNIEFFRIILPNFIFNGMIINGTLRHPVFLYESLLNLVGLGIMFFIKFKHTSKIKSGDLMSFYLVWYGMIRIFTESLRLNSGTSDPLMFLGMPVSIITSVLFIMGGITYFILRRTKIKVKTYQEILEETKNNKFDTIIFDLDGTLVNTNMLIERAYVHTFLQHLPDYNLTDEEIKSFHGPTLYNTLSKYASDEKKIKEMIKTYRDFTSEYYALYTKRISRVSEIIQMLHKKGYNLAVVSSKTKSGVEKDLEFAKINRYFPVVIGVDNVDKPKPDPQGILKAKANFKNTKRVLYVGDAVTDIQAGKNANIYTCACLYSVHKEDLIKESPDFTIEKFSHILKLLVE